MYTVYTIDFDAANLASTRGPQLFDGLVRLLKYYVTSASSLVVDIDDLLMVSRIVVI